MRFLLALLFAVCLSQLTSGQAIKLSGKVTDPQGAIVVGAKVTAIPTCGKEIITRSAHDGVFELELVQGTYKLEFKSDGFKTVTIRELVVDSLVGTKQHDVVLFGSTDHEPCGYGGDCEVFEEVKVERAVVMDKITPRPLLKAPARGKQKTKQRTDN